MAENVEKSKRDAFRERFAKRNPNLNMDDEDAYYGAANQFMDEYEGYENNANTMRDNIKKSPAMAEMILDSNGKENFDPVIWMVENGSLDLDALRDDPDYAKKLGAAREKHLQKLAKRNEVEKQAKENMPASIEAIKAKGAELKMTEEQIAETVGKMYQVMDDMILGKLSVDIFELLAKGANYDTAVEEAHDEGVAEGLNTKVDDKLRTLKNSNPNPVGRQKPIKEKKQAIDVDNPFLA
jgi:hypothetical protein